MAVELYIEDGLVDFLDTPSFAADYSIYNIEDISKRSGARSYAIKLPKTNRNKTVLESADIIPATTNLPFQKLKARCYADGVDLGIRFGYIESVKDTFDIRLFGENPDFFQRAGDVKLIDLEFCQYDHFRTLQNTFDNRNRLFPFVYPLIDNTTNSPNVYINNSVRNVNARNLFPAVYHHSVLDAIADYFNITIDNQVELTNKYPLDMLILPFSRDKFVRNRSPKRYEAKFSVLTDTPLNTQSDPLNQQVSPGVTLQFDTVTETCGSFWTAYNFTQYTRFAEKVRFRVEYDITFTGTVLANNPNSSVVFTTQYASVTNLALRSATNYHEIFPLNIQNGVNTNIQGFFDFETENSALGAQLLDNILTVFLGDQPNIGVMKAGSYMRITDVEILEDGEVTYEHDDLTKNYVTISSLLPDWSCAQFIKEYCYLFNALPVAVGNTLKIIPFNKIIANIGNALDWSDKIDFADDYEIRFAYDNYAIRNILKYADDDNVVKPDGTDGVLIVNNQNLDEEQVLIETMYGATPISVLLNGLNIPQIKLIDVGGSPALNKVEQRILVNEIVDAADLPDTDNLIIFDEVSALFSGVGLSIPYFIDIAKDFNLGFGNNLIEFYYNVIVGIIERPKIITVPLRLTAADISQLDFIKPIYFQQYESYFYISKIKAFPFTESRSTDVELVKLNL